MIMVVHKDIGMKDIFISFFGFFEDFYKFFSVSVLKKDIAPQITS